MVSHFDRTQPPATKTILLRKVSSNIKGKEKATQKDRYMNVLCLFLFKFDYKFKKMPRKERIRLVYGRHSTKDNTLGSSPKDSG